MLQALAGSRSYGRAALATPPDTSADPLLSFAGQIQGAHALIIGSKCLELLCRLLQNGCEAATTVRPAERSEPETYDLVLAPLLDDTTGLDRLVCQAKRALVPAGRFVAYIPNRASDPQGVSAALMQQLRTSGFSAVKSKRAPAGLLVRADFAMHGWGAALPRIAVRRPA